MLKCVDKPDHAALHKTPCCLSQYMADGHMDLIVRTLYLHTVRTTH